MDIILKDKNGVVLQTTNKICKEDIQVRVQTEEVTIKPTELDQVKEGLFSKVTVVGDENFKEENIREGTSMFGKIGTMKGADEEIVTSFISSVDDSLGANCTKLPNGLTSIGAYAFARCTNLALTELPDSVTSIKTYAFQYCTNLALTKLPQNLTSIGASAFQNCSKLAIKEIPASLTVLDGYNHFTNCTGLTEITFLGNVTQIGSASNPIFGGCSNLAKLAFPNVTSVPTLSYGQFLNGTKIASGKGYIYVPDNLVDSFKTATNWSTYKNYIKGISEL
jgi:hypothetical protein